MVLVIDNYDSFTYNLVQYLGELGARLTVKRNDSVTVAEVERLGPERIVISPGPGRPENAGITVELIQAFALRVPILGVCLGHQAIGLAFGSSIIAAPSLLHGKTSTIEHNGKGLFAGLTEPFTGGRYHSLTVDAASVPDVLAVVATAREDDSIMAIRHRRAPVFGVQFHPESVLTGEGRHILRNFLTYERTAN